MKVKKKNRKPFNCYICGNFAIFHKYEYDQSKVLMPYLNNSDNLVRRWHEHTFGNTGARYCGLSINCNVNKRCNKLDRCYHSFIEERDFFACSKEHIFQLEMES